VDKSSLWAPWQNGPYKNTQNITKHGVNKDATCRHKEITIFCVFRFFCFLFSIFNYLKDFSRKCWITIPYFLLKSWKHFEFTTYIYTCFQRSDKYKSNTYIIDKIETCSIKPPTPTSVTLHVSISNTHGTWSERLVSSGN